MSTPTSSSNLRIGSAERAAATSALDAHLEAGRLDAEEYGERVGRVSVARTQADLDPLFTDLPEPRPARPGPTATRTAPPRAVASHPVGPQPGHRREALGGRLGEAAAASVSTVALIVFFVLLAAHVPMAWLAFLAVPLVSSVVFGDPKAHKRYRKGRCGW